MKKTESEKYIKQKLRSHIEYAYASERERMLRIHYNMYGLQKAFEDGYECATKWIDVKERLPKKDETVLCAVEHLDGEIHTELRWRTIYDDVQMDENGFSLFTDIEKRVLAWMPLPEYKTNINNK